MSYPRTCGECGFYGSCNSGMNMAGCHFYPPRGDRKSASNKIKTFLGKFFK